MDEMLKEAQRFVDDPNNWAAIERIANRLMAEVKAASQVERPEGISAEFYSRRR